VRELLDAQPAEASATMSAATNKTAGLKRLMLLRLVVPSLLRSVRATKERCSLVAGHPAKIPQKHKRIRIRACRSRLMNAPLDRPCRRRVVDADFYCMHSELCKTLANDKRQMILGALRADELSVGQLVEATGISQANLSQHLAIMRTHGVVNTRKDGTRVFYSISNPKLIQAFDLITEVMQESLGMRAQSGATPTPTP
jgi:DNA-binding transcriptional ArsR family regulator